MHSAKNLNYTIQSTIRDAGVPEPGLNRRARKHNSLRQGGGLKILWRRPSWVQVPPPASKTKPFTGVFWLKKLIFQGL